MMPPPVVMSPEGILIDTGGAECCCGGATTGSVCCLSNIGGAGSCDDTLTEQECISAGGVLGPSEFTTCDDVPDGFCSDADPICACCIDPNCLDLPVSQCAAAGGVTLCCPAQGLDCPATCSGITNAGYAPCPTSPCPSHCLGCTTPLLATTAGFVLKAGHYACDPPGDPDCELVCCTMDGCVAPIGTIVSTPCDFWGAVQQCPAELWPGPCSQDCHMQSARISCASIPTSGVTEGCEHIYQGAGGIWLKTLTNDGCGFGANTIAWVATFIGQCGHNAAYYKLGRAVCDPCPTFFITIDAALS